MNFFKFDWADSSIRKIQIEYDRATMVVWNDSLQENLLINCSGLVGLTDLCIWDDTTIIRTEIRMIKQPKNDFTRKLYQSYDISLDYGGRSLENGFLELTLELTNNVNFCVYCLNIDVEKTGATNNQDQSGDGSLINNSNN